MHPALWLALAIGSGVVAPTPPQGSEGFSRGGPDGAGAAPHWLGRWLARQASRSRREPPGSPVRPRGKTHEGRTMRKSLVTLVAVAVLIAGGATGVANPGTVARAPLSVLPFVPPPVMPFALPRFDACEPLLAYVHH